MIDSFANSLSNHSFLSAGLAFGGFIIAIAAWAEKESNDEIKNSLSNLIDGYIASSKISDITKIVETGFDSLFGQKIFSVRYIVTSILFTTAWLTILSILIAIYWHSKGNLNESETLFYIARDIITFNSGAQYWILVPILVTNYTGDFFSITITRYLVKHISGTITFLAFLIIDIISSFLIYFVSLNIVLMAFGARTLWRIDELLDVALLRDSDAGPELMLSTFSTTFWFLLIAFGMLILRIAKRFHKFQNYKKRPFHFVGYLSSIPAFIIGGFFSLII